MIELVPTALSAVSGEFLRPYPSIFGKFACTTVEFIYPSYASFKALELSVLHDNHEEAIRWLNYWAIIGIFTAIERILHKPLHYIPYYPTLKVAFLLWLQLPRYSGAYRLTNRFVRPFLKQVHPYVDAFMASLATYVNTPEVTAVVNMVHEVLASFPVLEWFVRGPDGKPMLPGGGDSSRSSSFVTSR